MIMPKDSGDTRCADDRQWLETIWWCDVGWFRDYYAPTLHYGMLMQVEIARQPFGYVVLPFGDTGWCADPNDTTPASRVRFCFPLGGWMERHKLATGGRA